MNLGKWTSQIKINDFLLEWRYGSMRVFCVSSYDKCAQWISFLYVHVGGGVLHYDVFCLTSWGSGWHYGYDTDLMHRCIQGNSLYIPERFGVEGELYVEVTRTWCSMAKDWNWLHRHNQQVWRRIKISITFHLQDDTEWLWSLWC